MGRKQRIGMLNHKPVTRLRRTQISGNVAHFQNQHPFFLQRIQNPRRKGGIRDTEDARVELYFKRSSSEQNKVAFDAILQQKEAIESRFGDCLGWERLDGKRACRIRHDVSSGGIRTTGDEWSAFQDAFVKRMKRFDCALKPTLETLGI